MLTNARVYVRAVSRRSVARRRWRQEVALPDASSAPGGRRRVFVSLDRRRRRPSRPVCYFPAPCAQATDIKYVVYVLNVLIKKIV